MEGCPYYTAISEDSQAIQFQHPGTITDAINQENTKTSRFT